MGEFGWPPGLGTQLLKEIANFDDTARRLNAANRVHSNEVRTFQETVLNELAGVLDLYQERLADICIDMYERQEGRRAELSATERQNAESQMRTAFIHLFRLRSEVMTKRAPTLYVHAKCHAAIRWDKNRNLTGNDLTDFHHAAGALGYCDAFFTDNPLKVLLSQHHVGLPSALDCFVTADNAEAVEFIRSLSPTEARM